MSKRVTRKIRSWIATLVAMLALYGVVVVTAWGLAGAPVVEPGTVFGALLSKDTWLKALAAYPETLKIYAAVFAGVCALGIPLGIFWGGLRAGSLRAAARLLGFGLMSIPAFCLAYAFLFACVNILQVPVARALGGGSPIADVTMEGRLAVEIWFVLMPASVLAIPAIGKVAVEIQKALATNMRCPSMMALTSRGLSRSRRLYRYALPASWGAALRSLREALPPVMGASLLVEWIFQYPGVGSMCVEAVRRGDPGVVFAILPLLGVTALAWHAVLDLAETIFLEESESP